MTFIILSYCMHSVWAKLGKRPEAKGIDRQKNQRTTTAILSISCIGLARVEQDVIRDWLSGHSFSPHSG